MTATQTLERPAYPPRPLQVMGIPVVPFESYDQALECAEKIIESGSKSLWVAINPVKMYHAWQKPELRELLREADVGICDGVGGSFDIAAGRLKRAPKFFQMTGTEFLYRLVSEPRKRWPIQKVLLPYFLQVMGKKAVGLTLSDEKRGD